MLRSDRSLPIGRAHEHVLAHRPCAPPLRTALASALATLPRDMVYAGTSGHCDAFALALVERLAALGEPATGARPTRTGCGHDPVLSGLAAGGAAGSAHRPSGPSPQVTRRAAGRPGVITVDSGWGQTRFSTL